MVEDVVLVRLWIGERVAMVSGLAPKPPDQGAIL